MAEPFTSTGADLKPALRTGILQCRLKERCQSLDALKSSARLRRTPFFSACSAVTRACLCLRGEAAIGAFSVLVSGSSLRARRRALKHAVLMTSCT